MVIFSASAMFFYCIALVLVTSRLFHPQGPNRKAVAGIAAIAVVLHAAALSQAIFTTDGQNFSLTNVISLVNWIIAFTFTVMMFRLKVIVVVPVVYACSVLSVALLWLLPPKFIIHFELYPEVLAHVVLSLMAYSALMIAALYAIQLAMIQNKLKKKQLMLSPSIPPLMTVEKQLYHLVIIGVILLSLSLATGFIFLDDMFADGKGHKAILSIIAWFVYIAMLWQQYWVGCKIRTAVIYTLTGATLLSLAYFGARIVKELILS
ncbi:cytochrome c biogenesis protein CcsA [Shewanella oneidensis MR-1]|uniref:Cytochrome c assembly family protein n=1 Tax=Shewanella oneidensis (strain ATCC 700550 / JCM 31522 / CIP 106686 / LMG 19005 / NCIMB 14063 / MR-1) TaxID=211586 RepID=Q8EH74_SHEON|nr:cytochrome c biogenesis protein CcsA [Shewanella oneidensis]AAN54420.1 cytochrome c assembly family protein [Shewanella oneidensis MR-1]MDX5996809.1 cytochrome c biogenesis protein CcsA [Shewanella oneidensis]MEE2026525.1 Inner membrane protein YpjD [Shewanella oneidensis]QKG96114.1 cytochrome c biogenesis protein CcsA [Shewanella oneidensis MR-1]